MLNIQLKLKTTFLAAAIFGLGCTGRADDLEKTFQEPPAAARPQVLWMWMGGNVSSNGITRDLEVLHEAGFGGTMVFSLADVCTPWAGIISNCPTPEVVTFTDPWWKLVRHAAAESRRLDMNFGVHNCAGYESSGGPWITPELSMQEIVWSVKHVQGATNAATMLAQARPDLRAVQPYPVHNPVTGKLERPEVPARREFYRDVAVLALPSSGIVALTNIVDLTAKMSVDGKLDWEAPPGDWMVYRFGRTTMGTMLQPAQWDAIGLECDKMSREAVEFHMNHIIADAKLHLGEFFGDGFNFYHFDSYEARTPGWTPKMREEFMTRRGYDLIDFLPTLAKRTIGSAAETKKFKADFEKTIYDLYRENYFPTIERTLHAAGLKFMCEPYGGPWDIVDAVPHVDRIVTEFWTTHGGYEPFLLEPTVVAVRAAGRNLIEAEAFTGKPEDSEWSETPEWLKPIGDAAFCDGVNRMVLHRFTHQPYDDRYQPGMVMGQWGTHFDRTQTWWEPGKAWVQYLTRCQALLQWGGIATNQNDFAANDVTGQIHLRSIHRQKDGAEVYFVANLARTNGAAKCSFAVAGRQPELWNPVTGTMRDLPAYVIKDGRTTIPLQFAAAESCFIVFNREIAPSKSSAAVAPDNFPKAKPLGDLTGEWVVRFDPKWGGPRSIVFSNLDDWTQRAEPGIKYYSGTASYLKTFDLPQTDFGNRKPALWLDLGTVHGLAEVWLNGKKLGVAWTAPWQMDISPAVKAKHNKLEIKVTNVWANRLIGDEQEPADCDYVNGDMGCGGPLKAFPDWFVKNTPRPSAGRFTFTTWNYFTKGSALVPSGLLGPVRLMAGQ